MKKLFWIVFLLIVLFVVPTVFAQGTNPPISIGEVSSVRVIAFLAAGLSLFMDYFPGVAHRYDALPEETKRLFAVLSAIAIVGIAFGLTCASIVSSSLTCTPTGAWDAITGVIYVIIIQYSFHRATRPSEQFKTDVMKI